MNADLQQELEKLLTTLEPWQRQWVACRAAMRVLPALVLLVNFDSGMTQRRQLRRLPDYPGWFHYHT